MADRIQFRRDTIANWTKANPILMEGEVGYVTDNPNQYKIGDGVHAWNDLPLRGYTGTISQEFGDDENAVMSQKAVSNELRNLSLKVDDLSYSTKINVSTNNDLANPKLVDVNIKAGEMIYLYISDDEGILGNFKFTYYNGIDSVAKAFSGSSYAPSKYLEIEAPEDIKTLSIFGYIAKPGTLVYNVGIEAKLAYYKYLQEQLNDKIDKGLDVLSLEKSHNIGDVVAYDGWNYKFFNKISKVSLNKRINKGCYYVVNGKTYKCIQSTYNYIGQELKEGDIVFKDNKLNKFSNGAFESVSYDDLLPFLSEINEEQLIIDNALPYNMIGKHTYDIDIELGNNIVENPKLMAINIPLNSKIKVQLQGGVSTYQFTAYTSDTSTYSVFGGRIYPNMEYSAYMTKKIEYISCYIGSSEITEIGKATLHIEIDYSPITQLKTIPVVFDTDWGGDVDDGVAVSCLGWGNRIGKIKVVGAALSRYRYSTKGNAVIGLDANLHYYGIQNIPITSCDNYSKGSEGTSYNDICITYPHTLTELSSETPTSMYRRILSNLSKDVKLDIIVVGTSYNIKNLLNSVPKTRNFAEYPDMLDSELDGEELVNTRVGNIYYMAGCYNEEGKSYRFKQITLNADTSTKFVHTKISDLENAKIGDVISFRVLNGTGSVNNFKIYYKDKSGVNHEIPENKYLSVNTLYSYTLTEEAASLYIFVSDYSTDGTVRVESEINRPSLMKAEANMSWNGAHTTVGKIVVNSSVDLLKKAGCNVFFLGFENNCTEGAFLYGSGKTYDILYQVLNAYTGGDENRWKGLDSNGDAISEWTSGCIHGWDPLTTVLAIQGHKACGFGLIQGRNEIDTNQNVDGITNSRYGFNMFYSEDNGNHFYVYQQYSNSPFNNNRYQQMLDSIISLNGWEGNEDSEIIVLPRR